MERGCPSRSTFDNIKTREISGVHSQPEPLRVEHPRSVPFGQHSPKAKAVRRENRYLPILVLRMIVRQILSQVFQGDGE